MLFLPEESRSLLYPWQTVLKSIPCISIRTFIFVRLSYYVTCVLHNVLEKNNPSYIHHMSASINHLPHIPLAHPFNIAPDNSFRLPTISPTRWNIHNWNKNFSRMKLGSPFKCSISIYCGDVYYRFFHIAIHFLNRYIYRVYPHEQILEVAGFHNTLEINNQFAKHLVSDFVYNDNIQVLFTKNIEILSVYRKGCLKVYCFICMCIKDCMKLW